MKKFLKVAALVLLAIAPVLAQQPVTAIQGTPGAANAGWPITGGSITEATAAWTSATALNTTLRQTMTGYNSVTVFLNQSTTITGGVVTFEGSDTIGFTNAYPVLCNPVNSFIASATYTLVANTNQAFNCDVSGLNSFQVRLSTVIAGTATVNVGITANAMPPTATTTVGGTVSANMIQVAGAGVVADPCQQLSRSQVKINLTASGQLITGVAAKQTYICFIQFSIGATADNVALVEGTGTVCATGIAGMAGGATAATGWNLLANGSVTAGGYRYWGFATTTLADNVCLLASSASQISGVVQYVQQ